MTDTPHKPSHTLQIPAIAQTQLTGTESGALQGFIHAATADNTRKTYRSAVRQFQKWGGLLPCPPATLCRYLLDKADALNPRTLRLHLTAISQWHQTQGFADPTHDGSVKKAIKGIARTHGKPHQKATALRPEHISRMLQHLKSLPASHKQRRDQAILLVGFLGGFRRSELTRIEVSHLDWQEDGLVILLPRSKTDQTGEGLSRALPRGSKGLCPVLVMKQWLDGAAISEGPVFRPINRWDQVQPTTLKPAAVNDLLKKYGKVCGFDFVPTLSSHSLRRGMATSSAQAGANFKDIKKQGGWKSDDTVWGYIEEGRQFEENVANTLLSKLEVKIDASQ